MPSFATWSGRRIAAISAAWFVVLLATYWPLWYAAQLWWAKHRPRQPGAMDMTMLDIEVQPGWPSQFFFLLLALLVPAILLRLRARHRRVEPLGAHLTLR